ncbi:hypothetical protein PR048_033108 [Dryococelus australis]|uniref:Secreted protein n=1 Tax=Dryococelus australis TaxID=614101 RepID=A0ABQ9G2M8_9NEOP|nr:hypothetical protein PR048_033108 [Dryococelus australis]
MWIGQEALFTHYIVLFVICFCAAADMIASEKFLNNNKCKSCNMICVRRMIFHFGKLPDILGLQESFRKYLWRFKCEETAMPPKLYFVRQNSRRYER